MYLFDSTSNSYVFVVPSESESSMGFIYSKNKYIIEFKGNPDEAKGKYDSLSFESQMHTKLIIGEVKLTSNRLSILSAQGRIIKHGSTSVMNGLFHQMRQGGQQISCIESDRWDLDDLNKKIVDIPL